VRTGLVGLAARRHPLHHNHGITISNNAAGASLCVQQDLQLRQVCLRQLMRPRRPLLLPDGGRQPDGGGVVIHAQQQGAGAGGASGRPAGVAGSAGAHAPDAEPAALSMEAD
jgi:hypothetical protein